MRSYRKVRRLARRAAVRGRWIVRSLGDLLLPRACVVCGEKLLPKERHLCSSCMADIPQTYYWDLPFNPAADRLNAIIQHKIDNSCPDTGPDDIETVGNPDAGTTDSSFAARPEYEPYARCASLFFYNSDNGYRHICHRLKYGGDIALGRRFSRMLGLRLASSPFYSEVDAVVPVPLHWKRQWKRGYNQANIIAAEVAAVLGASLCSKLLVRKRKTRTQTVLTIEEKRKNVAGAFDVNPAAIPAGFSPRHILIIDDVLTTGSTTAECHAALRKIFPKARISIATLACVEG